MEPSRLSCSPRLVYVEGGTWSVSSSSAKNRSRSGEREGKIEPLRWLEKDQKSRSMEPEQRNDKTKFHTIKIWIIRKYSANNCKYTSQTNHFTSQFFIARTYSTSAKRMNIEIHGSPSNNLSIQESNLKVSTPRDPSESFGIFGVSTKLPGPAPFLP